MKITTISFITLFLASYRQVVKEQTFVKCKIPEVPNAQLEKILQDESHDKKIEILLNSCLKIKHERDLLKEAIKACQ